MMFNTRILTLVASVVASLLTSLIATQTNSSAYANDTMDGLAFQNDIILSRESQKGYQVPQSPSIQNIVDKQQVAAASNVDGLAMMGDTVMINELQSTSNPIVIAANDIEHHSNPPETMEMLASNGLLEQDNVVVLKTVKPLPPPAIYYFDRNALAAQSSR